jgi:hypothetical protein
VNQAMMLALLAYLAIGLIFFIFTLSEGIEKQAQWDAYRIAGLVTCFFWPCVLLLGIRAALLMSADKE